MKTVRSVFCIVAFSVLSVGGVVSDVKAAGPAMVQQSVSQIQSSLTDATVGCRRCWYRHGYGGYGYGGYGGYGYGYGGGYGGGYWGYGYSRPYLYSSYSYPAYNNYYYSRPAYYTGYYGYSPSLSSCNCGGYGYSSYQQPTVYSMSSYSYPTSVINTTASYPTGSVYGVTAPVYTPSYTSPSIISSPTPIAPPTYSAPAVTSPAAAPYPAPPVEYAQPSAYRAPIATLPMQTAGVAAPMINTPTYSPTFGQADVGYSAYAPVTYTYSSANSLVNRVYSTSAW